MRFEFEPTGKPDIANGKGAPGNGQLYFDEKLAGQNNIKLTNPLSMGLPSSIACGADPGSPVTHENKPPFPFTGTTHSVTVDVSGDLKKDAEAEARMILARQ